MNKPIVASSGYLNRPLRTLEQVERERDMPENKIRRLLMSIPFPRESTRT